jgi:DNA-damage-inducible protein J
MKTATLNIRLEPKLKGQAERVLKALGLSPTAAVTLFYRQIALRRALPLELCMPNAKTTAALEEIAAGDGRVRRGTTKQMVDAILHERD